MGFNRILQWLLPVLIPLFLVTGCGDLEPEMQDTRTVILNMDFDQRSSSRTSRVDPAELINYKTHLIMVLTSEIMVLTSGKNLSNNNYWDYKDSNKGEYVLYDSDREITLNMKLNTKMKIFAFLFRENYSHSVPPNDLFSANRDAGYYGESQIITIDDRQSRIPANIILNQVSGTDPAGGDFGGDPGDFGEGTDTGGDTETGGGSETAPAAPVISGISTGTYTTSQIFTVSGESGATIEYSLDGGSIWTAYSAAVTLTSEGSYTITARQRSDAAGNWSANATYITVVINQTTTTSCTNDAVSSCSATASGSFYVNNGTLSGIYDYFHILALTGKTGVNNSTGCASNSTYISGKGPTPTGTQSVIIQEVITSSTTFATKAVYYSDTACSSEIASMVVGYDEVSIGDNVTGLTTNFGNITHPSSASKVTYKESCMEVKGTTDVGTAYLNTLLSSSFVTTGQTHTCQGSGELKHALWAADNSSVLWESLHKEKSSTAAYPSDWSSDTDSSTAFTTIDNSLVAYYPFNGNVNDLTSNGRNLTVHGVPTLVEGKDNSSNNSAYSFDGVGDYLEYTTDIPSFDNYTISLWAKPASVGTYEAMFSSSGVSTNGFQIDSDGTNFHIRIAGGGSLVLSAAQIGKWTFIAFTYDGTNSIGYIDSVSDNESTGGTTEFNRFRIGKNRNGNAFYAGAIDELRIYNRALTASEISSLFAN